ncbi:hypothetical protein Tco_0788397 [Tanacetum coccineum]
MVVEKKCTRDEVRVRASISSSQSISSSLSYAIPVAIPVAIPTVLQIWAVLLYVSSVTTFIACPCLLILVVGIDPTITGSMTIPLAVFTLGCTLPDVVVIALGVQR